MKRILPRVLLALVAASLVGGLAVLLVPGLRLAVLGCRVRHDLKVGTERDLAVTATLTRGQDILGPEEKSDQPMDPQEQLQLNIRLSEKVLALGHEEALDYTVKEMRSEQLNADMKGVLSKEHFTLRVLPLGGILALVRSGTPQDVVPDSTWTQMLVSLWPQLPQGWTRPGPTHWSSAFEVERKMGTETVVLKHRLDYNMLEVVEKGGRSFAILEFKGAVVAEKKEGEAEVSGGGQILGRCQVDLENGTTVLGGSKVVEGILFRFPQEGGLTRRFLETQDVKLWRPDAATPDQPMQTPSPYPSP